jgi:SAM-dependent methyltransferase
MQACWLCGSMDKKTHAEKNNFCYFRCGGCGLIAIESVPENIADYYGAGYFTGDLRLDGYVDYENEKKMTRGTFDKYLELIRENTGSVGRLFEVGCATGCFLELASEKGWAAKGIDVSNYAVEEAKKKGLDAELSDLESFSHDSAAGFDAVAMFDVVEHLCDPQEGFEKIRSLLNVGGVVAFATPDAGSWWARVWNRKWHALVPPQHINIFSLNNLTRLLEKSGFKIEYRGHFGKRFSLPYIFRLLHTWLKTPAFGKISAWSGNNNVLKKISIPINLGDTMFIVARKIV